MSLSAPRLGEGTLAFDAEIRNLTGHKFPTGYPSRRAWLHVTVKDGRGAVVFESGAINDAGMILGNDSDVDTSRFEPHYEEITSPDQVQIYEPILGDRANAPTTGLLSATQYLKDNRLLPRGFEKATAPAEIGVYGSAARDADFSGGTDRVRYLIAVSGNGPFTVQAELRYQSIAYRWAHNLEKYDASEPKRFVNYFNAMASGSWVVVAKATTNTP